MKRILCFMLLVFALNSFCSAQDSINPADTILPKALINDFSKRFSKAEIDDWIKEGSNYIVSTFASNQWLDVTYSEKGKWVNTATLIDYEHLPQPVVKAFESSKYRAFEIMKITLTEAKKQPKVFRIFVENIDEDAAVLQYHENGNPVP